MPVQPYLKTARTIILWVLVFGLFGTGLELVLLGHDENAVQFVPLVLIVAGLAVIVWHAMVESSTSRRVMRATMVAFMASGALGIVLHYRGSVEFQKEIDPSIQGFALFAKAMQSKAPPALAPSAMTWFGLLGLAFTYMASDRREKT